MNGFRTLLENFWICKDSNKETYYRVKRGISNFQRFVKEQLSWELVHTENLLELEKRPAYAESFMGIGEFLETRDYCTLCVVLMYLKDKEEQEQFLLSGSIGYVETRLKSYISIGWTPFTQRKSLVRVLQYMGKLQILQVCGGRSEVFGSEAEHEVLYGSTGYSKYFAASFPTDISRFESWEDFEKTNSEGFQEDRGTLRIGRVCRQLTVCPSMYWESSENTGSLYLKNQRQWVAKYINDSMGSNLDLYKDMACISLDGGNCYGSVHPRDTMLPEIVLLVYGKMQEEVVEGTLKKQEGECIYITRERISDVILPCHREWNSGWSKEYRETDEDLLLERMLKYMKSWLITRYDGAQIIIFPSIGRTAGVYPEDLEGGTGE